MAELRRVDPAVLIPNPNNPRRTPAPPAMDEQLLASIKSVGIIQPPLVKEENGTLVIIVGDRRRQQAVRAGLETIDVLVCTPEEAADAMRSLSENLIRASMNSVDVWRAIQALEAQGWNEQSIADALALPLRSVRKLKLLAHLHPPMLDVMAAGTMPSEDQLRTVAAASREEQAQVWKKHKPKKGHDFYWSDVARALTKRRIPFSAARFGEDLARAYGVTWHDDLFAPAGEDSRYTTNVEGFFGAQQEWMANTLPAGGTLLRTNEYGQPELPKKAERTYGKLQKGDLEGYYLDGNSGEVKTVGYRMPEPRPPAKGSARSEGQKAGEEGDAPDTLAKPRPEITQKGHAMIGALRTDALREALLEGEIDDRTLIGLLAMAFAARNVGVQSSGYPEGDDRTTIVAEITAGGVLSSDDTAIRTAARRMLAAVLSCQEDRSNSGPVACIAGDSIGASLRLPTMATDEFLSCLSKPGIEAVARAEGIRIHPRGKDTRAAVIDQFKKGHYVHPAALFARGAAAAGSAGVAATSGWVSGTAETTEAEADDGTAGPDGEDVRWPSSPKPPSSPWRPGSGRASSFPAETSHVPHRPGPRRMRRTAPDAHPLGFQPGRAAAPHRHRRPAPAACSTWSWPWSQPAKPRRHVAARQAVQMHDRETWDQSTWQRYIAAAADVEHEFGPPMRQLYREIDQLERVLALPSVTGAAA